MKNGLSKTILIISFITISILSYGQQRAPGDPGEDPGTGDPLNGGGAPIGGGLYILLGLGAAYGGRKMYKLLQEKVEVLGVINKQ